MIKLSFITYFHCRIVSLEMATNMSMEITVLCGQSDCGLTEPRILAVVENKLLVVDSGRRRIHVSESK